MGVCTKKAQRTYFFLLFTMIYPKMLIRQFLLCNNLLTQNRENLYFLWQLPSFEANFEGCEGLSFKTQFEIEI